VFLARSRGAEGVDKLLVVKRILPAFAANARFRAMFVDEAKVALRLNHPNVVQVYGFESDGPSMLLVMEYVDGPDLAAVVHAARAHGERLAPGMAAWIAREVARGLHYAHERRDDDDRSLDIVHRDVSPGNILLSFDGAVKLGDFGIAKARSSAGEEEGSLKGKFTYMAPEQARGSAVDRRADLYSLGIVLGELLAGRPLTGDVAAPQDLLPMLRRGETPDIRRVAPNAPDALLDLVARLLAPDRNDRFDTARDVAVTLTRYLRALRDEWDATAVSEHIARWISRTRSMPPPAPDDELLAVSPDSATVPRIRVRPPGPLAVARGTVAIDSATLMRERTLVAVIVGRLVSPIRSEDTVDTRPVLDLVESVAFKAQATLERTDEGRFSLVLGILQPNVEHALIAAHVALDLAEAVRALAVGEDGADRAPGLALGIARGVAAVARGTDGSLIGFEVVDDAVSFATSLADTAAAGEILLTPALSRLVRRSFALTEHSTRSALASRVWRLERVKSRGEREEDVATLATGLMGRDAELAQLREAFVRTRDASAGSSVLVTGELGIGKSALLATFAADPRIDGEVLRVPVAFGTAERTFHCIAQILGELLGVPENRLDDRGLIHTAITRAVQIANVSSPSGRKAAERALSSAFGLPDSEGDDESANAREVALVLRRLLAARAILHPLALIVDGVDLADRASRHVLEDLLRHPPARPVLLVVSVRDTDELLRHGVHTTTIPVPPLGDASRGLLIAKRLGADRVGDDLMREVSAAAGGNPLMILEVVEALGDRARLEVQADADGSRVVLTHGRDSDLPLPATLEEVLAARIDALPAEARTLARWCALVEAELSIDLLEQIAGTDAPRAIGRLVADGILVRVRGRSDTLTFAHAVLARVATASIDPTQLAGMHARLAAVFERRPSSRGAGAGVVARHREAAGAVRPAARSHLEFASAQRVTGHFRDAITAYARVLALTRDATDPEGHALRFAAHVGREEIARAAGMIRIRRAELLAMRVVAVQARDVRLVARALARQARYRLEAGIGGDIERDVNAALRAARRAGEPRTEAEARRVLALHLGQRGRYVEALQAADGALHALDLRNAAAAPPGGAADDGVRAARTVRIEVLLAKGTLLRHTGEIERAIDVYAEAYALLQRHGPRRLLAHVMNNLGVASSARGSHRDSLRLYLAAIALHRETGSRDRLGLALSNAGQTYAVLGQNERALAFLRKAVEVFQAVGSRYGRTDTHVALAELYAARGDTELALLELEHARTHASPSGRFALVRVHTGEAVVALARGEYRAARASAEEAERLSTEAGMVIFALHGRALAAQAAAASGDLVAARQLVEVVLAASQLSDPTRMERGDLVLRACEHTLHALGDHERATAVAALWPPALRTGHGRESRGDVR